MTKPLLVLNGPGLDKLGDKTLAEYGSATLGDVRRLCEETGVAVGYEIDFRQSNDAGDILKWVVDAGNTHAGIVINPAIATRTLPHFKEAYTAIMYGLSYVKLPTIEVHLSNVFVHGDVEYHSYISTVSTGLVSGFGIQGYAMAIRGLVGQLASDTPSARDVMST